jgi:immune inhibitor A
MTMCDNCVGGTWIEDGRFPPHPSAWCKVDQGWVKVETLTDGDVTIEDVKTSNTVYKLPLGGTGE